MPKTFPKKWTPIRCDYVLEYHLTGHTHYLQKLTEYGFGSEHVLSCQLWKLAVRYPIQSVQTYQPGKRRLERTNATWTDADRSILYLAVGPVGRRNNAYDLGWLSVLLGRDRPSIAKYTGELVRQNEGLAGVLQAKDEDEGHWWARRVHNAMTRINIKTMFFGQSFRDIAAE